MFTQITLVVDDVVANPLADFLHDHGALAVTLADAGDEPVYQEKLQESPLWQKTKVVALFSQDTPLANVQSLIDLFLNKHVTLQTESVTDQNWVALTQSYFQPQHYAEKLWVLPNWYDEKSYAGTLIKINPGLAFGTGTHATTALCLTWLAENPPQQLTMIDYGCGSGILALASLALGAKTVIAIDHDPQALIATQNNADLNAFIDDQNLKIYLPHELPSTTRAELIIANILANPLITLADHIQQHLTPEGTLILSGFFAADIDKVFAAYANTMEMITTKTQDQWACLALKFK